MKEHVNRTFWQRREEKQAMNVFAVNVKQRNLIKIAVFIAIACEGFSPKLRKRKV
jgi:hypothetical protein